MRPAPLGRPAIVSLILLAMAASGLAAAVPAAATARHAAIVKRSAGHKPFEFASHIRRPRLPAGQRYACSAPTKPGEMECLAVVPAGSVKAAAVGMLPNATAPSGYGPADLRAAYKLAAASAAKGAGMVVGIVDAYNDPRAAADLAVYRAHYGLPACTTKSGCLRIVNQNGVAGPLPKTDPGWAAEESLDLDMVSAICPKCKIILVEANSSSNPADLGTAENTAVAMGARFISNSWGGGEFPGEQYFDHYFNHPGVAITFASGDSGYGTSYPADIQYVTAVGGTNLVRAKNARGWTETVWGAASSTSGTGSGCSSVAVKAPWQTNDNSFPAGCLNRTGNDVAAVADPVHGVAVYDSLAYQGILVCGGWCRPGVGGTSVSSPIIAAVYALAGAPPYGTFPASYPYQHYVGHFFDVTTGTNAIPGYACEPARAYLCHAKVRFDGPTGLGTPNGIAGFSNAGASLVTLLNPGTQDVLAGTAFSLRIRGYTNGKALMLSYTATGLPAGLTVSSVPGNRDGLISGTLPAGQASYLITVTGKDGTTGQLGSTTFRLVASASLAPAPAPKGLLPLSAGGVCLTDPGTLGGQAKVVTCASASGWAFQPGAAPGANQTLLSAAGRCLGESAGADQSAATVQTCDGSAGQQWFYAGGGLVGNAASGLCLGTAGNATATGTVVQVQNCVALLAGQAWTMPDGPVVSGVTGCLTGGGVGGAVTVTACVASQPSQQWTLESDGTLRIGSYCLGTGGSANSGHAVTPENCATAYSDNGQVWFPGPSGQLMNGWYKCLYFPGGTAAVVQQDCYGLAGEIWSVS